MKQLPIILVAILLSNCSVFMAAKQPDKLDTNLFVQGTPRSMLLAEFGMPKVSEVKKSKRHEIFTFTQGYSSGAKAGRAVGHGIADVLTLGLWEVVGTPAEGAFDGNQMAYEVTYDKEERVDSVILLKRK